MDRLTVAEVKSILDKHSLKMATGSYVNRRERTCCARGAAVIGSFPEILLRDGTFPQAASDHDKTRGWTFSYVCGLIRGFDGCTNDVNTNNIVKIEFDMGYADGKAVREALLE